MELPENFRLELQVESSFDATSSTMRELTHQRLTNQQNIQLQYAPKRINDDHIIKRRYYFH